MVNLSEWDGDAVRCVRLIPNLTSEQHVGISLVVWDRGVRPEDKGLLLDFLNAVGTVVETDEDSLEVCTNLTSCGPAPLMRRQIRTRLLIR
jgi:competence protein ComER